MILNCWVVVLLVGVSFWIWHDWNCWFLHLLGLLGCCTTVCDFGFPVRRSVDFVCWL